MTLTTPPTVKPLWYMASVYSKYAGGTEEAFKLACYKAAELMKANPDKTIFSPIAHSHPVEKYGDTPKTHDFWLGQDVGYLHLAEGMFVYEMPGIENSFGVNWEKDYMKSLNKPIIPVKFLPADLEAVR